MVSLVTGDYSVLTLYNQSVKQGKHFLFLILGKNKALLGGLWFLKSLSTIFQLYRGFRIIDVCFLCDTFMNIFFSTTIKAFYVL